MHKLELEVATDHVERLTKFKKPILAIEELIWNALDADAKQVRVDLAQNRLGALERITVRDDGHGITPDTCDAAFGSLGGSPKLKKSISPTGRQIHGSSGEGRFKAFGLGPQVVWKSCYAHNDAVYHFKISGRRSNLKQFEVTDPVECDRPTGVSVEIRPNSNLSALLETDNCVAVLSRRLALYLRAYPGIEVLYGGCSIDPSRMEDRTETYPFEIKLPDEKRMSAELTVIEWNCPTERALYLCDKGGFARDERPPRIQAKGWDFTAYVKSDLVDDLDGSNLLAFEEEIHPGLKALLDSSKDLLRTHFRKREEEESSHLVQQWKQEEVYPYSNENGNPLERAEREVFNVCAVKVHDFLPNFEESDRKNKRLTFRLLKQALESNPTSLQTILREVLALPEEQQDELAKLLERTRLSAIINAAQVVLGRLDFLASLDSLLFGDYKKQLLETNQMQQILLRELWIFGEQYGLGVDDQSLQSLLAKHLTLLEREELVPGETVKDLEGKSRRVDLMLHQRFPRDTPESFEHLVIELKRPSVRIGQKEITQVEQYAYKVADDERFDKQKVQWNFLLLGNSLDDFAKNKCNVRDREYGHIYAGNPNIYVKTWSSVIDPAKWRYEFFRDQLATEISTDGGLEYLRTKYPQFIPS